MKQRPGSLNFLLILSMLPLLTSCGERFNPNVLLGITLAGCKALTKCVHQWLKISKTN